MNYIYLFMFIFVAFLLSTRYEYFTLCDRFNSNSMCCDVYGNFIEKSYCSIDLNTNIAKHKYL